MLYKLLGMLTWRAVRRYGRRRLPRAAVAAGTVAAGVALLTLAACARDRD